MGLFKQLQTYFTGILILSQPTKSQPIEGLCASAFGSPLKLHDNHSSATTAYAAKVPGAGYHSIGKNVLFPIPSPNEGEMFVNNSDIAYPGNPIGYTANPIAVMRDLDPHANPILGSSRNPITIPEQLDGNLSYLIRPLPDSSPHMLSMFNQKWFIKDSEGRQVGPGNEIFSKHNVYAENGRIVMNNADGKSSEIASANLMTYGDYVVSIASLGPQLDGWYFGIFTFSDKTDIKYVDEIFKYPLSDRWRNPKHEVDIVEEIRRTSDKENAQFAIQHWLPQGNIRRIKVYSGERSYCTRIRPNSVEYAWAKGKKSFSDCMSTAEETFIYRNTEFIPQPDAQGNPPTWRLNINYWNGGGSYDDFRTFIITNIDYSPQSPDHFNNNQFPTLPLCSPDCLPEHAECHTEMVPDSAVGSELGTLCGTIPNLCGDTVDTACGTHAPAREKLAHLLTTLQDSDQCPTTYKTCPSPLSHCNILGVPPQERQGKLDWICSPSTPLNQFCESIPRDCSRQGVAAVANHILRKAITNGHSCPADFKHKVSHTMPTIPHMLMLALTLLAGRN